MKLFWKELKIFHFFLLILIASLLLLSIKLYYERVGTFSFGDEYNNFIAAYFYNRGRQIFSQIFFNHQILIVYISAILMRVFHPSSLYKLLLIHRMFIVFFSLGFDILLFIRFRYRVIGLLLFYEIIKYYYFGNLFLAESLILYPLVYLFLLSWIRLKKETIFPAEFLFSGLLAWFVLFMREPYVPLSLLLFCIVLWGGTFSKEKRLAIVLFLLLSAVTLFTAPLKDFYTEVILFNITTVIPKSTLSGQLGFLQIPFYPLAILMSGKWNYLRILLISLDICFLFLFGALIAQKKYAQCFFIFFVLTLAAVRPVPPGFLFFESFHMIIWIGLFLTSISMLIAQEYEYKHRVVFTIAVFLYTGIFLLQFVPQSYVWERVKRNETFTINYATHYLTGEAIHRLSRPGDTLFADTWDYLLYWQAGIDSAYQYAVYTFIMTHNTQYNAAKSEMFHHHPPTFYYTFSPLGSCMNVLPDYRIGDYIRIYSKNKNICLFMTKTRTQTVTQAMKDSITILGFSFIRT